MLSAPLFAASRSARVRELITTWPVSQRLVDRFVAGEMLHGALTVAETLVGGGLFVTLDHLGESTLDAERAAVIRDAYVVLLVALAERGLADRAEVSIKLSAMGQALPGDGHQIALVNAFAICQMADQVGTTVTVDMEDHTTADSTLAIVGELRAEFPWTGAVLQSCLRRTEADCADLAASGARVRLVKGAYAEPASVAYQAKHDVDRAYVRCLRTLMESDAYPMVATHDPRLIAITQQMTSNCGRDRASYEFQMLYGIRTAEQRRLAGEGHRVRAYVPYGSDWYGYFMRRLAERPANLAFFLRSLAAR